MADILENPVDLIDDAYEQEIQVEQEMIEVVAYRSYNQLDDKPQINGVELVGNKTSSDLGITAQIESAINSEAQARAQADNTLQGKIDTEKLARQQADSTLQGNIDAEETARQASDKDIQDVLDGETLARQNADIALGGRIDTEIHDRQVADIGLQGQIDAITSKSDVVDVVATYADLQAYDTQHLGNNDVVKVLDDETHEDALTYYRWSTTTQTWSYIGQEAPYYSKGQMDVMLQGKQDTLTAGANIQISNDVISATDTTYTAGNGLNLNGTEFSADTDVLATKEDLEGYYTKPETDNLLAPKLEAEVVTELPTTGAEGKLYLTPKAHTTQTATGNPIEATVTEQAGQLESFQLDGDTFQQSYTGKNLFDDDTAIDAYIQSNGAVTPNSAWRSSRLIKVEPNTRYTWHGEVYGVRQVVWAGYDSSQAFISGQYAQINNVDSLTIITGGNTEYLRVGYRSDGMRNMQLELGSTASDYEPFVGGQPSPSPEYPQPIQTVTGLQTITINGTDYSLDLGTIELCKLGTYQDYIWKDGEDWKVHKATSKVSLDGSESWSRWITPNENTIETRTFTLKKSFFGELVPYFLQYAGIVNTAKSDRFTVRNTVWDNVILTCCALNGDGTRCLQVKLEKTYLEYSDSMTTAELEALFKAWLVNKPTTLYYALATATDTIITDQTLIAQLEAIRTAALENGTNTITNTATGTNLAGDMEIGYYGFNPTNRYDKWLWLDLNNNYEQIGS